MATSEKLKPRPLIDASDVDDAAELASDVSEWADQIEALPREGEHARQSLENALRRFRLETQLVQGPKPSEGEPWIALKAARRGSCSYETVRRWAKSGFVKAKKVGARYYVLQSSLDAYMNRLADPLAGNNAT